MNVYRKFFAVFLFLSFTTAFATLSIAQSVKVDSCGKLKFHSAIEKDGFGRLCEGTMPDFLAMAVAVNPESGQVQLSSIREAMIKETSVLKAGLADIKKPAKKLKFIFDHVQTTFLKQYDLDADFSEMFRTGKYNCLTATILYAWLLDELSVKHTIKFMPGHVYLIVHADEIPYIFETTDPVGGFVELSKVMQSNAVQSMRLMKFMASDNGKNDQAGDLFERYYIKLNNTEMKGLVGYQYTNAAFVAMMKQDYTTAYNLVTKAKIFTPMSELDMMQDQLLRQAILQADKTTTYRAGLLVNYYNSTKDNNKKNQIADEFKQSIYLILFSSFPSPDSLMPVYHTLYNGIADEDMRKVLEEIYFTAYISYLQTESKKQELFEFMYSAYSKGNKSAFIKSNMHNSVALLTDDIRVNENGVAQYDTLANKYPLLMEVDLFVYNRCQMLINSAEEAFRMKNGEEGERLLKKFDAEGYYDKSKPAYCNPAYAYSLAGSYYFRKNNIPKARASLVKGLTFDPDNWELKKKLSELR